MQKQEEEEIYFDGDKKMYLNNVQFFNRDKWVFHHFGFLHLQHAYPVSSVSL